MIYEFDIQPSSHNQVSVAEEILDLRKTRYLNQ